MWNDYGHGRPPDDDEDGSVDIPVEMFDDDEKAVLAPVFVGGHMEAELIRSMLEAHDIPAVVFGSGHTTGLEEVPFGDRVMVRAMDVEAALETIRSAEVGEGEIVTPDSDDIEIMVDEDFQESETADDYDLENEDVPVLAGTSDWGPRIAGLIGIAALVTTAIVILKNG